MCKIFLDITILLLEIVRVKCFFYSPWKIAKIMRYKNVSGEKFRVLITSCLEILFTLSLQVAPEEFCAPFFTYLSWNFLIESAITRGSYRSFLSYRCNLFFPQRVHAHTKEAALPSRTCDLWSNYVTEGYSSAEWPAPWRSITNNCDNISLSDLITVQNFRSSYARWLQLHIQLQLEERASR